MYKINDSLVEQKRNDLRAERRFFVVAEIILAIILIIASLNTFVWFNVRVSGPSMQNTLDGGDAGHGYNNGEVLIANKLKTPSYGDIIIVDTAKGTWIIKRVIALEGDTVKIEGGYVYLNDEKLDEPYVKQQGVTNWGINPFNEGKPYTLKDGEIFYLGDNRENSSDSRDRTKGVCTLGDVVGVVEDWSMQQSGFLKTLYSIPQTILGLFR